MNKKEKIEQEINKTLSQFEHKDSLPPNPYFFTRVQQRLNKQPGNESTLLAFLKPALIIVLFVINIGTVIWYFNNGITYNSFDKRQELIEILSSDLNLGKDQNNLFLVE